MCKFWMILFLLAVGCLTPLRLSDKTAVAATITPTASDCLSLQQQQIVAADVGLGFSFLAGTGGVSTITSLPLQIDQHDKNTLILVTGITGVVAGVVVVVAQYYSQQKSAEFINQGCSK
jgi:hypothetical protein